MVKIIFFKNVLCVKKMLDQKDIGSKMLFFIHQRNWVWKRVNQYLIWLKKVWMVKWHGGKVDGVGNANIYKKSCKEVI